MRLLRRSTVKKARKAVTRKCVSEVICFCLPFFGPILNRVQGSIFRDRRSSVLEIQDSQSRIWFQSILLDVSKAPCGKQHPLSGALDTAELVCSSYLSAYGTATIRTATMQWPGLGPVLCSYIRSFDRLIDECESALKSMLLHPGKM